MMTRRQPLIPAVYFCQEPRISNWVRRALVEYVGVAAAGTESPVITESIAHTAVPYFLVLGSFEGKYVSLMVDEGLRHIFEVPVIADRGFFRGSGGNNLGTVVSGDLIWEYPIVGGGSGSGNHVIPRQCFFVNRLFKVAGVGSTGNTTTWTTAEYTLLRNLFDPLGADVLQNPRTWNTEARKLASMHRKIVCAGTCFGLIFKPRKWFPVAEKETMERLHIPNLRYEIDQPLRWVGAPAGGNTAATALVHLQLQVNLDTNLDLDWRIYYRSEKWDKIDATLAGPPHIIFLPNELIMRWMGGFHANAAAAKPTQLPLIIVLVRLSVGEGLHDNRQHHLEAETVVIRSEKALPDTEECIRASCAYVAKLHTSAA